MTSKRKFWLIAVIAFVLTIAATLFFTVGASNEVKTSIDIHNVALEEKVYLKYYVRNRYVPDDAERGLLVWFEKQNQYTIDDNPKYTILADEYEYKNNVKYDIYYFDKLTSTDFAKEVYAVSYVKYVVDNDTVYTYSEVDKYSILQYAYNMTHKANPNTNLCNLLTAMLEYGSLSQQYFGENLAKLANATYFGVTLVNATLPDGTTYGLYAEGSKITVNATVPQGVAYKWVDYDGNTIDTSNIVVNGKELIIICDYVNEQLTYTLVDDSYYKVTNNGFTGTDLYIPSYYNGKPVKEIEANAFSNCTNIKSVFAGINVKTIGANAFSGCTNLESATLPKAIRTIGESAFKGCTKLSTFKVPSSTTTIGANAFANTSITFLTIPDTVTSLGTIVTEGTSTIKSLVLGSGVTNNGGALLGTLDLDKLYYKGNATKLEALLNATEFNSIKTKTLYYTSCVHEAGYWSYNTNGDVYTEFMTDGYEDLGYCPSCSYKYSYTINYAGTDYDYKPEQVNYTYGTEVNIPSAIKDGYYFAGWYLDEELTQPISKTSKTTFGNLTLYPKFILGSDCVEYADNGNNTLYVSGFDYNKDCTVIYIADMINGKKVTRYDPDETTRDYYIRELYLADTITKIDSEFTYCDHLRLIKFGNEITALHDFVGNTVVMIIGLNTTEITGYDHAESRPKEIYNLSSMDLTDSNIAKNAKVIHTSLAEDRYYYNEGDYFFDVSKKSRVDFAFYIGTSKTLDFPALTGKYANRKYYIPNTFAANSSKYVEIKTNGNVKGIGDRAFYNNMSLTRIDLGEGLQTIGFEAFKYCHSIQYIVIPKSLTSVGTEFVSGTKTIYFHGTAEELATKTFLTSYINTNSLRYYANHVHMDDEWSYVNGNVSTAKIELNWEHVSGLCTDTDGCQLHAYCDENGKDYYKTIKGEHNYVDGICTYCGHSIRYTITYGTYGAYTSYVNTNTVTSFLPNQGIITLGPAYFNDHNFEGWYTSQYTGSRVYTIDTSDPNQLHDYKLYPRFNSDNSRGITYVTTDSGNYALTHMDYSSYSIFIPDMHNNIVVTQIGDDNATSRITGNGYACTKLMLPNGLKVIGPNAFKGFADLTSVILPKTVEKIGADAFLNCSKLTKIYYMGTEAEWNALADNNPYCATIADKVIFYEMHVHTSKEWKFNSDGSIYNTPSDGELVYTITKASTCCETGKYEATCSVNNKTYEKVIPVDSSLHEYVNGECIHCHGQKECKYYASYTSGVYDPVNGTYANKVANKGGSLTFKNNDTVPLQFTFSVVNTSNINVQFKIRHYMDKENEIWRTLYNTTVAEFDYVIVIYPGEGLQVNLPSDSAPANSVQVTPKVTHVNNFIDPDAFTVNGKFIVRKSDNTIVKYTDVASNVAITEALNGYKYDVNAFVGLTNAFNAENGEAIKYIIIDKGVDSSIIEALANVNSSLVNIYFKGTEAEWDALDANATLKSKVLYYTPHVHETGYWNYVNNAPSTELTDGCLEYVVDYEPDCIHFGRNVAHCDENNKDYYIATNPTPDNHNYNGTNTCIGCGLKHEVKYDTVINNLVKDGSKYYNNNNLVKDQVVSLQFISKDTELPVYLSFTTELKNSIKVTVEYYSDATKQTTEYKNIGTGASLSYELMCNDYVLIKYTATGDVSASDIIINNVELTHSDLYINPTVYETDASKKFLFNTIDGKYTLTKYIGTDTDIVLPVMSKDYYLADNLFKDYNGITRQAITSVTFNSNVKGVGKNAFANTTIEYLLINKELEVLPQNAITNCGDLTAIYYLGTVDQWIELFGSYNKYENVYLYDECAHDEKEWHYDSNNKPITTPLHDDLGWTIVTKATCSTEGYSIAVCPYCNKSVVKRTAIDSNNHNYDANGKCIDCGTNYSFDYDITAWYQTVNTEGTYGVYTYYGTTAQYDTKFFAIVSNNEMPTYVSFDVTNNTNGIQVQNHPEQNLGTVGITIERTKNGNGTALQAEKLKDNVFEYVTKVENVLLQKGEQILVDITTNNGHYIDTTQEKHYEVSIVVSNFKFSIPQTASTESSFEYKGFLFEQDGSNLTCVKYLGTDTTVTFPNYFDKEYTIADDVFKDYNGLGTEALIKEIILDSHVKNISNNAFRGCVGVETIEINQYKYLHYLKRAVLDNMTSLKRIYFAGYYEDLWSNTIEANCKDYDDLVFYLVNCVHADNEWTRMEGVRSTTKSNHNLTYETITAATCTTKGKERAYCDQNQKYYYREIDYKHSFDNTGHCSYCHEAFNASLAVVSDEFEVISNDNSYIMDFTYLTSMNDPKLHAIYHGNSNGYVYFTIINNSNTPYYLTLLKDTGAKKLVKVINSGTFTYGFEMDNDYSIIISVPSGTANNTHFNLELVIDSIEYPNSSNATYSIVSNYVVKNVGDDYTLVKYLGNDTEIRLPDLTFRGISTYSLGANLFKDYNGINSGSAITDIKLTEFVQGIDANAFNGLTGVTVIQVSTAVTGLTPEVLSKLTKLSVIYFEGSTLAEWHTLLGVTSATAYDKYVKYNTPLGHIHGDNEWTLLTSGERSVVKGTDDLTWVTTTESTCTTYGVETGTCPVTHRTYTRIKALKPHTFDANGICTVCGKTLYTVSTFGMAEETSFTLSDWRFKNSHSTTFAKVLITNNSDKAITLKINVGISYVQYNSQNPYYYFVNGEQTQFTRELTIVIQPGNTRAVEVDTIGQFTIPTNNLVITINKVADSN